MIQGFYFFTFANGILIMTSMSKITRRTVANEEERMLIDLNEALHSKKKSLQHFADLKLEAYQEAEKLNEHLRMFKVKDTDGEYAKMRTSLSVRYVGYLPSGKIFDSGVFTFCLGRGEVIEAWDLAFKHLRVGEEAILFCPSSTAYGRAGAGKDIKSYTTLIFDVVLEKAGA